MRLALWRCQFRISAGVPCRVRLLWFSSVPPAVHIMSGRFCTCYIFTPHCPLPLGAVCIGPLAASLVAQDIKYARPIKYVKIEFFSIRTVKTYEVCSKKDRTFAIKTLLLILQHFKHCPPQSSPLYWQYTVPNVSSVFGMPPGKHLM